MISTFKICNFFETVVDDVNPNIAANLLTGDILSYLNKHFIKLEESKLTKDNFIKLVELLDKKTISSKQGKEVINILLDTGKDVLDIVKENKMEQISDNSLVLDIVTKVIDANPDSVKDFKDGKDRAVKYLMGQIMKESKGQVNPGLANQVLIEELKKL